MEATIKLAIQTYSELTGRTFEQVVSEILNGNEAILESVQMLMFAVL